MIDKSKKPSALEVAKEIAKTHLNRRVINKFDAILDEKGNATGKEKVTEVPIESIYVTIQDHGVYVNSDLEAIQSHAADRNLTLVTVMENGVVVGEGQPKKKSKAE